MANMGPPARRAHGIDLTCPVCVKHQGVDLIKLTRNGYHVCVSCHRRLTLADVERALHAPRH